MLEIRNRVLLPAIVALGACVVGLGSEGRAAEPIKIGFASEITGPLSDPAKQFMISAQIWAEDVNAAGGILGRPVQLVYYDDQSNPANVPGIYSKLLDVDHVDMIVSQSTVMTAPGRIEAQDFPYPDVGEDAIVIALEMCGICGTDKHTYRGETVQYGGTAAEISTPFPIIPGHEIVGKVAEIGSRARTRLEYTGKTLNVGDRVVIIILF